MGDEKKVYSFSEVSQHKTRKDCWLVINGKVYDVTKFLDDHPGGDEVLLLATGKDATDDFEDVGHSTRARETMEEYYVGEVDPSTIIKRTIHEVSKNDRHNQKEDFEIVMIRILQFLVPLAILGLGVGIPLYYAK